MSSGSHQNYTRVWANELNVPIFSIDYRLAPKDPFPAALNDVWQVYYWLIEYGEAFLGIKPEKIFVSHVYLGVVMRPISQGISAVLASKAIWSTSAPSSSSP